MQTLTFVGSVVSASMIIPIRHASAASVILVLHLDCHWRINGLRRLGNTHENSAVSISAVFWMQILPLPAINCLQQEFRLHQTGFPFVRVAVSMIQAGSNLLFPAFKLNFDFEALNAHDFEFSTSCLFEYFLILLFDSAIERKVPY